MQRNNSEVISSKLFRNYQYAVYGAKILAEICPYGGINRVDVTEAMPPKKHAEQLVLLSELQKCDENTDQAEIDRILHDIKGASSGMLCTFAVREITEKYPNAMVEIVNLAINQVVVIGRNLDSNVDERDIKTWGADTVIFDPWSKQIYEASQFFEVREKSPVIPFYQFKGSDRTEVKEHYLSGNPCIFFSITHQASVAEKKNDISPDKVYKIGMDLFNLAQYEAALKMMKQALILFKENGKSEKQATCHSILSSCYEKLNQIEKAKEHCQLAYEMRCECLGENHLLTISAKEKAKKLEDRPVSIKRRI